MRREGADVNINVKSPDPGSGLLGLSDVLPAPLGAVSIHRAGLEAALSESLKDLVFRESNI